MRLVWPDKKDGRRKQPKLPLHTAPEHDGKIYDDSMVPFDYGQQFLNISYDDIERSRLRLGRLALNNPSISRLERQINLFPALKHNEADLLHYCEPFLSFFLAFCRSCDLALT
jgi:hypothetical protein